MRLKGLLSTLAIAILVGTGLAGCGSSADSSDGESYEEILIGLKKAARTGEDYAAVRRAEDLEPVERASTDAFCETNQEMLLNEEAKKVYQTQYYISRIKLRAERELPFVSTGPVNRAVNKLDDLYDLASFDVYAVTSYQKACYR